MRTIFTYCLLLAATLSFSSCEKEEAETTTTETADAILSWSGDYALDGCGYTLIVGEKRYKPTNEADIPAVYKQGGFQNTPVEAKFLNYNKKIIASCSLPYEVNAIKILELRTK